MSQLKLWVLMQLNFGKVGRVHGWKSLVIDKYIADHVIMAHNICGDEVLRYWLWVPPSHRSNASRQTSAEHHSPRGDPMLHESFGILVYPCPPLANI